jgi:hypothetical protein
VKRARPQQLVGFVQHDDKEPNADDLEFASGGAMPFAFYHMINAHPSDEEYFDTSVPDHSLGVQLSLGPHVPLWIRNSTLALSRTGSNASCCTCVTRGRICGFCALTLHWKRCAQVGLGCTASKLQKQSPRGGPGRSSCWASRRARQAATRGTLIRPPEDSRKIACIFLKPSQSSFQLVTRANAVWLKRSWRTGNLMTCKGRCVCVWCVWCVVCVCVCVCVCVYT